MRELTKDEYGRLIAALTEYADTHPDADEADKYFDLSELVTDHRIYIDTRAEIITARTVFVDSDDTDSAK